MALDSDLWKDWAFGVDPDGFPAREDTRERCEAAMQNTFASIGAARRPSRLRRLIFGLLRGLARMLDPIDEHLARRRRLSYGRKSWLLSWSRDGDGRWCARLSGPGCCRTIERRAITRLVAIRRSARALARLPALRRRIGPRGVAPNESP